MTPLVASTVGSQGGSSASKMAESFSRNEARLKSEFPNGGSKINKPTSVAGCRERRKSSARKLREDPLRPSYCIECSSVTRMQAQESSFHSLPANREYPKSALRASLDLSRVKPTMQTASRELILSTNSKDTRDNFFCFRKHQDSKTSATTNRFRARLQRLRPRAFVSCMNSDSDSTENFSGSVRVDRKSEQTESDTCSIYSRTFRKKKGSSTSCDRIDSARSSQIKALFTDAQVEKLRKTTFLSAAFSRLFRFQVMKFRSSTPAMLENMPNASVSPRPSPNAARRCRRQETLVKMMERELAEHSDATDISETEGSTRRTKTEIKHRTAPHRLINACHSTTHSKSKDIHGKGQQIRTRSSSKKVSHKRCATL